MTLSHFPILRLTVRIQWLLQQPGLGQQPRSPPPYESNVKELNLIWANGGCKGEMNSYSSFLALGQMHHRSILVHSGRNSERRSKVPSWETAQIMVPSTDYGISARTFPASTVEIVSDPGPPSSTKKFLQHFLIRKVDNMSISNGGAA